jgi:hypothetical protein
MMVVTEMGRNKNLASFSGQMVLPSKAISRTTISKVQEHTFGRTVVSSQAIGSITKWKAREHSRGQTNDDTLASTEMIRKKALGLSFGQMGANMLDSGWTENRTDLESIRR